MIVLKKKSTNEFKARLVVRGDTMSEAETAFSSAPTTGRGSVAMLLVLETFSKRNIATIDVTQAFLQFDDLKKDDKLFVILPPYIAIKDPTQMKTCQLSKMAVVEQEDIYIMPWAEYKSKSKEELKAGYSVGLITHKPLYG